MLRQSVHRLAALGVERVLVTCDEGNLASAAVIERCHQAAIKDALDFIEAKALFTRRGTNGVRQVDVRGLVATAFTHRDSRAGDPDLHTHVAVANKVQTRDGRWLSIDGRVLYKAVVAASETYNTALERHLTRDLGVRFAERADADPRKRPVRGVRLRRPRLPPAFVVEAVDQVGIASERGRCRHVLDRVILPQTAAVAERPEPAFGRKPGAGKHHDAVRAGHRRGLSAASVSGRNHGSASARAIGLGRGGEGLVAVPELVVGVALGHADVLCLLGVAEEAGGAALVAARQRHVGDLLDAAAQRRVAGAAFGPHAGVVHRPRDGEGRGHQDRGHGHGRLQHR